MNFFRSKNSFDEAWYLTQYPDVKAAIEEGKFESGRQHYQECGEKEGRFQRNPVVDEAWYLASNPDVAAAVEAGLFKNAHEHYIRNGCREGRKPTRKS